MKLLNDDPIDDDQWFTYKKSINKESIDILVGSFGFTAPRYRLVDYPYPVTLTQMALMIPKPTINTRTNYIAAILEPFQLQVDSL